MRRRDFLQGILTGTVAAVLGAAPKALAVGIVWRRITNPHDLMDCKESTLELLETRADGTEVWEISWSNTHGNNWPADWESDEGWPYGDLDDYFEEDDV